MKIGLRALLCNILLIGLIINLPLYASERPCKPRYPSPEMQAAMYDLAAITLDAFDNLPADVNVLIAARAGQDLSRYGLRHSHVAFLVRNETGNWQVIHLLNRCKSKTSSLYREGLVNFIGETAPNPAGLRIAIPVAPLRTAIAALLTEPAIQARALHQSRYSAIAYPWGTKYQNSNQWILEVIAAAMAQVNDGTVLTTRHASTRWLQEHSYHPSRLHIGFIKRVGARLFAKNVAVMDHPYQERWSGTYSVVTVESIFDFLYQQNAIMEEITMMPPSIDG